MYKPYPLLEGDSLQPVPNESCLVKNRDPEYTFCIPDPGP